MRPSERLTTSFLAALAALALAGTPRAPIAAAVCLALGAATLLLVRAGPGPLGALRDFLPVAVVLAVFLVLEPVISGVNPRRWDAFFAAWDARWLGPLVLAWRGAFGRSAPVVDAGYLAYLSYYPLPVAVAVLARRRGPEVLERAALTILLAFYASYAGYFLFPTSGPRLPPADEARLLGGSAVSDAVRLFLHAAEKTRLDAFPSGHTAVALVSAVTGARLAPRAAPAFAIWAIAIVFSTVFIHVHYAVDVLAGAVLAAAVTTTAGTLSRGLASLGRPRTAP